MQSQPLALRRPLPGARRRPGRPGRGVPDPLAALRGTVEDEDLGQMGSKWEMICRISR